MAGLSDPRIERVVAPLPADAPDPADFRYEPDFEALDALIKTAERDGPMAVAWGEVANRSLAILETRSKDLTVACWLALALARTEGTSGLAVGLAVLRAIVGAYWDTMFPPKARSRARVTVLEWVVERLAGFVPQELPADAAPIEAAYDEVRGLDDLLGEKLGADAVSLASLLQKLRALHQEIERNRAAAAPPPADPSPPPTPATVSPAVPTPAPAAPPPVAAASPSLAMPELVPVAIDEDRERALGKLRDGLRTSGLALQAADPAEPRAYLLLRTATWLGLDALPPQTGGRTSLNPPPDIRRGEFEAFKQAGDRLGLVAALEKFCSGSGFFWLDGQRMAAQALAELGPRFALCSRLINRSVLMLLDRLPGLAELSFVDGTPFADAATSNWLQEGKSSGPNATGETMPGEQGYAQARGLAADGDIEGAQRLLSEGIRTAGHGRARFGWQLAQARLWLDSDRPHLAIDLLRHLDAVLETQGLEAWEPALAVEVGALICRCLARPELAGLEDDEARLMRRHAFARLVRTDPAQAARLAPSMEFA